MASPQANVDFQFYATVLCRSICRSSEFVVSRQLASAQPASWQPRPRITSPKTPTTLICHHLTADRWGDFETLFGKNGACAGCWCTTWRQTRSEFNANKGAGNRRLFLNVVRTGPPPGILGYLDGEPVAWCAVAPRADYPSLERSRLLQPVDDTPVWSGLAFSFVATIGEKG